MREKLVTVRSGVGTVIDDPFSLVWFTDELKQIMRVPRVNAGWSSITYKGKSYMLMGGVRGPFFICLNEKKNQESEGD